MMVKRMLLVLSASLLLFGSGICSSRERNEQGSRRREHHPRVTSPPDYSPYPINLTVFNSLTNEPNKTFSTLVAYRGILLGAMRKIQTANMSFNFTYTEHADYGPFLVSVNGVAGSPAQSTYWELLVNRTANWRTGIIIPNVGIGCFIPEKNDNVILKYTTY